MLRPSPSDAEHQEKARKKERQKSKRKKTERKVPRVSIINIEQGGEVVECQMEGANCSTVSFKFNPDDDKPSEIAENLVSEPRTSEIAENLVSEQRTSEIAENLVSEQRTSEIAENLVSEQRTSEIVSHSVIILFTSTLYIPASFHVK